MKVSLMVMSAGKSSGKAIPVTLSQFIIGRDPQCNLRPASAVISKRHCAILIKNGKVFVRDFDSTNGTFVNENPVKGEVPLNHQDILKVGPLAFQVAIEKTTPVNKPTPAPAKSPASGNDDDVAAMLLSLQEPEIPGVEESTAAENSDVPGGSTIMDMVPLPDTKSEMPKAPAVAPAPPPKPEPAHAAPAAAAQAGHTKPAPAAKPEEKKPAQSARDAAKAILEKYVKRHRG
jgi:pSer/pThr/pTyr-binding forkhead associated (FHA) protein